MLNPLSQIALQAGKAILEVYQSSIDVEMKTDRSPLTTADKRSHEVIVSGLENLDPAIPILSEEGHHTAYAVRSKWNSYWCIDPLDGTKEFINRNGEFTVNIARIDNGIPTIGIVYAPVLDTAWYGDKEGAVMVTNLSNPEKSNSSPIQVIPSANPYRVVASRSHMNEDTRKYIDQLKSMHPVELVSMGSSLKICAVAEGSAQVYPRFGPTMEWDTAAGHAVLNAAGGSLVLAGKPSIPLTYNKENLLNPYFIALAK